MGDKLFECGYSDPPFEEKKKSNKEDEISDISSDLSL